MFFFITWYYGTACFNSIKRTTRGLQLETADPVAQHNVNKKGFTVILVSESVSTYYSQHFGKCTAVADLFNSPYLWAHGQTDPSQ